MHKILPPGASHIKSDNDVVRAPSGGGVGGGERYFESFPASSFAVVWKLSDDGMVERFVAERRICSVHGISCYR